MRHMAKCVNDKCWRKVIARVNVEMLERSAIGSDYFEVKSKLLNSKLIFDNRDYENTNLHFCVV